MPYVPPFALVKKALRVNSDLARGQPTLVGSDLLRLLLRIVVAEAPFDEAFYLENNPDIRDSVETGKIVDPFTHYISQGYFEGRRAAPVEVHEEWYLHQYPDVAEGISAGRVTSAESHYRQAGESELRIPNPELAEEIRRWAEALRGAE